MNNTAISDTAGTVYMVDPQKLKGASFVPASRVLPASLSALIDSMRNGGFHPWAPIVVGVEGVIGDGHRRWAVAKYLGVLRVPVVYTNRKAADIWGANMTTQPVTTKEALTANLKGWGMNPNIVNRPELLSATGSVAHAKEEAQPILPRIMAPHRDGFSASYRQTKRDVVFDLLRAADRAITIREIVERTSYPIGTVAAYMSEATRAGIVKRRTMPPDVRAIDAEYIAATHREA